MNGKQYVGMTKRTVEERWKSHCSHARNGNPVRFAHAIRKYGEESFTIETLYDCLDLEECRLMEIKMVKEKDTFGGGYNANAGGTGGDVVFPENKEKHRANLSKAMTGDGNPKHSGYSDDELLSIAHDHLEKHEGKYFKVLTLHEVYDRYPKSFSACRFAEEDGGGLKRFNLAYAKKYGEEFPKYIRTDEHRQTLSNAITGKKRVYADDNTYTMEKST